jgi:hypothetical protein
MTYLILAILTATAIFAGFRAFPRWGADTFQVIVINYAVAAGMGWWLAGGWPTFVLAWGDAWLYTAIAVGSLFLYLFHLMARSAQVNGLTVTTVAAKLSMVLPVLVFLIGDSSDELSWTKTTALLCSLPAVVLASWKADEPFKLQDARMPLIIFFGGGMIDLMFGWFSGPEHMRLPEFRYLFTAIPFTIALLIGLMILAMKRAKKSPESPTKRWVTWTSGLVLGFINFGSLYFLLQAYSDVPLDRSAITPLINLGVVLSSALLARTAFKEQLSRRNALGLALGCTAMALLLFS